MSNQSSPSSFNREGFENEVKGDGSSTSDMDQETDQLVVCCLNNILELHNGTSESLSSITNLVNESFPQYTPAAVHNCLVTAFPDLQAQQSTDKEEIYYLGIRCINAQSAEYKITNWLWRRFRVDEFGSVSFRTLLDIANKELGFVKNTVIGHYVKKAFPTVYTRRSDRLRWYCGISLPEKELTPEEREKKGWLDSASTWLRNNMKENPAGKEQCSLVFAALTQFVGKVSIDICMAAIKCVFPNVPRKTVDRNAFYIGIHFSRPSIRDEIKFTPSKCRGVCAKKPILNEEEKSIVVWLQTVIQLNDGHREKLHDLTNLLRKKKMDSSVTEKTCLNYIRKAFPYVSYRKRDGVAQVSGIEIKKSFKPVDRWMEKAVKWVKEILVPHSQNHSEKVGPILEVMKKGLQITNHSKLCHILRVAYPQCFFQRTLEGKYVFAVGLNEGYREVILPKFSDEDFMGDFSSVDMNNTQGGEGDLADTNDLYLEEAGEITTQHINKKRNIADHVKILEDKLDRMTNTVETMNETMNKLRDELSTSNRQKDTLIVQLQQTLVLLSQQQFQRLMRPTDTNLVHQDSNFLNLQNLPSVSGDVNKPSPLS